jgi:phosphoribosyl 1,2-cyclic phosphate phosphodiesterase
VKTSLTILGCGTSTGVPLIGCKCAVCRSQNPKNHRLRAAAWLRTRGKSILIDTSTDLRAQALRHKIHHVDAVLYTHPHSDHVLGIDELRSYNFLQGTEIPVYGNAWTCEELPARFDYVFNPPKKIEGGGVPRLVLNQIRPEKHGLKKPLLVQGVPIIPIRLQHGSKEVLAYRIDAIAYVTDTSYIPTESLEQLRGLEVLVLDCLRLEAHGTHFNLDQALEVISQLRPRKTFLTHLGHDFEYTKWSRKLPKGVFLAYDGLTIALK